MPWIRASGRGGPPRAGAHQFHAEAAHVVVGRLGAHHLDGAARQPEEHRPHGVGAAPVNDLFQRGGHHAHVAEFLLYSHSSAPFFHAYTKPMRSTTMNTAI